MTKHDVLALLRSQDGPLSGQAIAEALHVSRTAVWKAVGTLQREGYRKGECRSSSQYELKSVHCSIEPVAGLPQSPPAAEPAPSRREPRPLRDLKVCASFVNGLL